MKDGEIRIHIATLDVGLAIAKGLKVASKLVKASNRLSKRPSAEGDTGPSGRFRVATARVRGPTPSSTNRYMLVGCGQEHGLTPRTVQDPANCGMPQR